MSNGVPHIINRLPAVAARIEEAGAGIVIDYDREQLANAILTLLTDDRLHEHYRRKGLELAESRASGPIFRSLFDRLGMPVDGATE
jgi:UDP:flavonoid glycosyltransferase YjiC (YdhE family)